MGAYIPWYLAHKTVLRNFCVYNDTHTLFLGQVTTVRGSNDSTTGVAAPPPPYKQPELGPEPTCEELTNNVLSLEMQVKALQSQLATIREQGHKNIRAAFS